MDENLFKNFLITFLIVLFYFQEKYLNLLIVAIAFCFSACIELVRSDNGSIKVLCIF